MPSAMASPTRRRGLREPKGSWNTICMRARRGRSAAADSRPRSCPAKLTRPPVGSSRRRMALPTVVLPQPDSPTSARVRPAGMSRDTPSTARTWPTVRWNTPRRMGKCTFSSCTSSSVPSVAATRDGGASSPRGAAAPRPASAGSNRWQRTVWPSAAVCQAGTCAWQRAQAWSQRGAKRQAVKRWVSGGTRPGMVASRVAAPPGRASNSFRE